MAPPTLNERFRDLSIRHQIQLHRLANGTAADVSVLLRSAEADIVAQLAKYDPSDEGGYSKRRLGKMLDAIRKINDSSYAIASDYLQAHLEELAQYEADYQARQIEATIPFDWPLAAPTVATLDALVNDEPFAGHKLDDWLAGLSDGQFTRLKAAINIGVVQGETVDQLVRRIRGTKALNYRDGVMEIGRRQAENVVRTATSHSTNAARIAVYKENSDLISKVQWLSTLDLRTTILCMSLDGSVYSIDEPHPTPPAHYNCRSVLIPVIAAWEDLGLKAKDIEGTRASVNGQVADKITYPEWLKGRPAAEQDEALGVTRGKLFRDGDLPIDRFVDHAGETYTLDELRRRDAEAFAKAGLD